MPDKDYYIALGEAFRTVSNTEYRVNETIKALEKMIEKLQLSKGELQQSGIRLSREINKTKKDK